MPTSSTSSTGSGPFWRRICAYEPPSQYSMTMYGRSSSVIPVSMIETMCGWLDSATVVASSRSALTGTAPVSMVITLIATGRLSRVWIARNTSAVVPCAISCGSSYPGSAGSSGAFNRSSTEASDGMSPDPLRTGVPADSVVAGCVVGFVRSANGGARRRMAPCVCVRVPAPAAAEPTSHRRTCLARRGGRHERLPSRRAIPRCAGQRHRPGSIRVDVGGDKAGQRRRPLSPVHGGRSARRPVVQATWSGSSTSRPH